MPKYGVDMIDIGDLSDVILSFEAKKLEVSLFKADGPAGGNWYFEFTGERENFAEWCSEYYDNDPDLDLDLFLV